MARDPCCVGRGNQQTIGKRSTYSEVVADSTNLWEAPETPDEDLFVQNYGGRIKEVYNTLIRYRSSRKVVLANAAYLELYKVN